MKKLLLSLATVLCASAFASAAEVTDVLNNANLVGGKTTVYDDHTYTAESGATYYAQCAGGNESIQLRSSNSNSGVIVTKSVGTVKSITITFNTNTASNRVVNVYGSDAPFTDNKATGLYNGPAPVTTFTASNGTTQTYTFETEYAYIGFRSNSGALYIDKVDIVWNVTGEAGPTVEAPKFSVEGGKYFEAQTVEITAAAGSTIYYTIDGTTPSDESIKYEQPITISTTTTLKAIAYDADDHTSSVTTATYTISKLLEGAEGEGTEANPYNAIGAYNAALLGSIDNVYVKGTISSIKEISPVTETSTYGNASYYISADGTANNEFYIYRGYSLGGEKFTSEDEIQVGDVVVVYGALTTYNDVPQLASGNKIVSINGEEPEPIVLEGEGTEANPFTVADIIKINPSDTKSNEQYPDKYWVKGYIVGRCDGQAFAPVFDATPVEGIDMQSANIVLAPSADCTEKELCIPVQLPTGDVRTALNLVDNPTNLGKEVHVYGNIYKYFSVPGVKNTNNYKLNSTDSAIAIESDANAPVEYFNLQGVRVDNPAKGLYIMRQGSKVVKVVK
ncbi:MAG: DUF6359 domain-containing protein [Bacteroidales bacterium]|nr:DUF6359 domain-containing protein [Bacteroidales bacterium]